ncbi:MAG: putative bifunctional diguanylate cyclase/phosphodiesterase, partial [Pseudomonadota bacterium]
MVQFACSTSAAQEDTTDGPNAAPSRLPEFEPVPVPVGLSTADAAGAFLGWDAGHAEWLGWSAALQPASSDAAKGGRLIRPPTFACPIKTLAFDPPGTAVAGADRPAVMDLAGHRLNHALALTTQSHSTTGIVHNRSQDGRKTDEDPCTPSRDHLTGIYDESGFRSAVETELSKQAATAEHLVLCFANFDQFKLVNEFYGRPAGDALLRAAAGRLDAGAGPGSVIGRLGGDEFGLLLRRPDAGEPLDAFFARLLERLGRTYLVQGHAVDVGVSIGFTVAEPGSDWRCLEREANLALHEAQRAGGRTARRFVPALAERLRHRCRLEVDLRRALPLRQFELHYQPQFDPAGRRIVAAEALLRWNHPERGLVGPAEFVPLSEATGAIVDIGHWALRRACRDALAWPREIAVAVNLSPIQVHDPGLLGRVEEALAASGLPPERLVLEVTESALLQDSTRVRETLERIRRIGVATSLDDFGIGFSSLDHLQRFSFDELKLDGSFVRTPVDQKRAGAIVDAVATLAHVLGMRTVAEGVETAEHLQRVAAAGYSAVQGFLLGRPMVSGRLSSLLAGDSTSAGVLCLATRK